MLGNKHRPQSKACRRTNPCPMELSGADDVQGCEPTLPACSGHRLTFSIDRILGPDFGPYAHRARAHKLPVGKAFTLDVSPLFNEPRYFPSLPTPPAETEHHRYGFHITSPGLRRRKSCSPVRFDGQSLSFFPDSYKTDGHCTPPTPPKIVSPYLQSPALVPHPFDRDGPVDSKSLVYSWVHRHRLSPETTTRQHQNLSPKVRLSPIPSPDKGSLTFKHVTEHPLGSDSLEPKTKQPWSKAPSPCSKSQDLKTTTDHPLRSDSLEPATKKLPSWSNVPSPCAKSEDLKTTIEHPPRSDPLEPATATKRELPPINVPSPSAKDLKPTTDSAEPVTKNRRRSTSPSEDLKPNATTNSSQWIAGNDRRTLANSPPAPKQPADDDRCSPSRCPSSSSCESEKVLKIDSPLSGDSKPEQSKSSVGHQKSADEDHHQSGDKSAIVDKELKLDGNDPWPVWVYCSRYSPRPSSGPRSRRQTKKEHSSDEKRCRTAFSGTQLSRLRQEFQSNPYLSENRRLTLAQALNLTESQIKIWFQNRRAKVKRTCKEKDPLAMKLMEQGLYNHKTNKS